MYKQILYSKKSVKICVVSVVSARNSSVRIRICPNPFNQCYLRSKNIVENSAKIVCNKFANNS